MADARPHNRQKKTGAEKLPECMRYRGIFAAMISDIKKYLPAHCRRGGMRQSLRQDKCCNVAEMRKEADFGVAAMLDIAIIDKDFDSRSLLYGSL